MVATLYIILCGCGQNPGDTQSIKIWNNYVKAIRSGDSHAAGSYFTPESRPYFTMDSALQDDYTVSKFTIIKAELDYSYIRLKISQENEQGQAILYKYLIPQQETYRIQYPFLIFAAYWPVKESPHFAVHGREFAFSPVVDDSTGESIIYDPEVLEAYYAKIKNCTGSACEGTVDYYFCRDKEEAGLLSGQDTASWIVIGPCVISTERYDLADVTRVIVNGQKKPCDLLYYGLLGYGELERAKMENAPMENINTTTAKYIAKLNTHPLSILIRESDQAEEQERRKDMFFIGGALVKYLIDTYGTDKFRELYQSASTADDFREQLFRIYEMDLNDIQVHLIHAYQPYFQSR
jgi:hypothetical protein